MEGMRAGSEAARFLARGLRSEDFTLVDVGCSGGVDSIWSVFGDALRVYGFDISETAIAELKAKDTNPKAAYVARKVMPRPDRAAAYATAAALLQRCNPWERLAAHRTQQLRDDPATASLTWEAIGSRYDPRATAATPTELTTVEGASDDAALLNHNLWHRTKLARDEVFLPAFFDEEGVRNIDFIKIDVDGPDYGILESLEDTLGSRGVLGVGLEVNFIGTDAPGQHTFHNTDRFMRKQGFQLFGLTVRRYSSAALPFMYTDVHPYAHRAVQGRPVQGDALYVRDFGFEHTAALAQTYSDEKLLKLAALFALAGLSDQAAEVLLQFRSRLSPLVDVGGALDLLTQEVQQEQGGISTSEEMARGYDAYVAAFNADDPRFYGSEARWWAWREDLWTKAERLRALGQALETAAAELEAIKSSRAWRLARGWHAVVRRLLRRGAHGQT